MLKKYTKNVLNKSNSILSVFLPKNEKNKDEFYLEDIVDIEDNDLLNLLDDNDLLNLLLDSSSDIDSDMDTYAHELSYSDIDRILEDMKNSKNSKTNEFNNDKNISVNHVIKELDLDTIDK